MIIKETGHEAILFGVTENFSLLFIRVEFHVLYKSIYHDVKIEAHVLNGVDQPNELLT